MSIDRKALVRRHNPSLKTPDPYSPLSVGNGDFAFTADFTGLQTFLPDTPGTIPLCTMSQWGFHSYPEQEGFSRRLEMLRLEKFSTADRKIGYMTDQSGQEALYNALRVNPHRLNLGRIGFVFDSKFAENSSLNEYNTCVSVDKLVDKFGEINQSLDLWTGLLDSRFKYKDFPVHTMTSCHPTRDIFAFRVESPLLQEKQMAVGIAFPYGSHNPDASDWSSENKHSTSFIYIKKDKDKRLLRVLDSNRYFVDFHLSGGGQGDISMKRIGLHEFILESSSSILEVSIEFSPIINHDNTLSWKEVNLASAAYWENFWTQGGMIELSDSPDQRAIELERRIILSRYLTAIQCSGFLPPQETGLTCNSWYGKFHLEMHYWHAAHFPLWGKSEMLERSLWWYKAIQPEATRRARSQGYTGLRWPKMTDPSGVDSPSPIGPLLCWQQPHPIMFAELLRLAKSDTSILEDYSSIVFESAEFMADYAQWNDKSNKFVLGPPLIPAQENHSPYTTLNPTFELEYWRWGLTTALDWKRRLGRTEPKKWVDVLTNLVEFPMDSRGKLYLAHECCPDSFGVFATDHPSMLCAFGVLPGLSIDKTVMSATLDAVLGSWDFDTAWGWDFPVMAMTSARLGRRVDAVDILLMAAPKNTYRPNGHNAQLPGTDLPLYLPGNGGLLLAVSMMAKGWSGSSGEAPGFPDDGSWIVKSEDLKPFL